MIRTRRVKRRETCIENSHSHQSANLNAVDSKLINEQRHTYWMHNLDFAISSYIDDHDRRVNFQKALKPERDVRKKFAALPLNQFHRHDRSHICQECLCSCLFLQANKGYRRDRPLHKTNKLGSKCKYGKGIWRGRNGSYWKRRLSQW